MDIAEAARELGRKLCSKVPQVCGTSEIFDVINGVWKMYVDIETANMQEVHTVIHGILKEIGGTSFCGYEIDLRIVGTPKFAGTEEAV